MIFLTESLDTAKIKNKIPLLPTFANFHHCFSAPTTTLLRHDTLTGSHTPVDIVIRVWINLSHTNRCFLGADKMEIGLKPSTINKDIIAWNRKNIRSYRIQCTCFLKNYFALFIIKLVWFIIVHLLDVSTSALVLPRICKESTCNKYNYCSSQLDWYPFRICLICCCLKRYILC